jgi:transposase
MHCREPTPIAATKGAISDEQWARIGPHLPKDVRGVERADDRRVISGIVHVLSCGCLRVPKT